MKAQQVDPMTNFINTVSPLAALALIVGTLLLVLAIAFYIRMWMVQTATFKIQADLEEIKNSLSSKSEKKE